MQFPKSSAVGSLLITAALLAGCSDSSDDKKSNPETPAAEQKLSLSFLGRHATGEFGVSAAEIVVYHAASKTAFAVNALNGKLDVINLSDPQNIATTSTSIGVEDDTEAGSTVNSVSLYGDVLALAIQAAVKTDNGWVGFYDANTLDFISKVRVGALPDMLTFTPDGKTVLVANEGEPSDDYQIDPEGSISVIDVSNIQNPSARTAAFTAFNDKKDELIAAGVRIFGPGATVAMDLEPEYIAVSADGKTAWAALQENNAIAEINIGTATVTDIWPMGYKDHGAEGQGMDAYDEDGAINITLLPGIKGIYQPDAMLAYNVAGKTYLVTANEGDARAWGEDNVDYWGSQSVSNGNSPTTLCTGGDVSKGFVEELRAKHLTDYRGISRRCGDDLPPQLAAIAGGAFLNPANFGWCGATDAGTDINSDPRGGCDDSKFGRLNITWTMGYQTWPSGAPKLFSRETGAELAEGTAVDANTWLKYDNLYSFGGRSFSIWDTATKELVYDSGDFFEKFLADLTEFDCGLGADRSISCADYFNSNHEEGNALDNRSDNKGPEPEGLAHGRINGRDYLFVGLERMGGILVFDITTPASPIFKDYINTREDWTTADPSTVLSAVGDLGPEGLYFVSAENSPTDLPILLVGNEVSGTVAVYAISTAALQD